MKRLLFVALLVCAPLASHAADINTATLRGRVLFTNNYFDNNGTYRFEVGLLVFDGGADAPYSPVFDCGIDLWDEICQTAILMPGCTPECSNLPTGDFKMEQCACPTFNPGAGLCLDVSAFHDGNRLLTVDSSDVVENPTGCSPLP